MSQGVLALDPIAKMGRLWFRYRSYSPLPLLAVVLLLPPVVTLTPLQELSCIGLMLLAETLRVWAVGYAGSITRTRGDGVGPLVHAGPFRFVRNPLYIANIALYVSCGALFGLGAYCFLAAVYFFTQYSFIIAYEESTLERNYGDAFLQYCEKVPRWLPTFWPAIESSQHSFALQAALRSERSTFIAIAVIIAVFFGRGYFF